MNKISLLEVPMDALLISGALILTFLLLGWRFGFAFITLMLAMVLCVCIYAIGMDISDRKNLFSLTAGYMNYFIYTMWTIGAAWRLSLYKNILFDFKGFMTRRKYMNTIEIGKYKQ
ncbi:UNVERIFIED_ORG: hypothetical protein M2414_004128 [Rahnella aquatilis]